MKRILQEGGWIDVPPKYSQTGWRQLLATWANLIEKYTGYGRDGQIEDIAYWYGERALTGLLAAAAWQTKSGWWGLEEFLGQRDVDPQAAKNSAAKKTSARKRKSGSGRGDLWLGLRIHRKPNRQHGYTIEAKQTDRGASPDQIAANITKALGKARDQLRRLNKGFRWGIPVAVCYHIPAIIGSSKRAMNWDTAKEFEKAAAIIRSKHSSALTAAVIRSIEDAPHDGKWIFPGVLLVAVPYERLACGRGRKTWKGRPESY